MLIQLSLNVKNLYKNGFQNKPEGEMRRVDVFEGEDIYHNITFNNLWCLSLANPIPGLMTGKVAKIYFVCITIPYNNEDHICTRYYK